MAAATKPVARRKKVRVGSEKPRIAPPVPLKHGADDFAELGERLGQPLWPWQRRAARYITATSPDGWLYPEVCLVVARQNGKTTLLAPLIVGRLLDGQSILHAAQNRELPRGTHKHVARLLREHFPEQVPNRNSIRFGAGQEEISTESGGSYRIVAATDSGARGPSANLVIVDEVRALKSADFIEAAQPTTIAQELTQTVYLSNAGTTESVVLNSLRARAGTDEYLAYLEWSAAPERSPDDVAGWLESNPSIGHNPWLLRNLERVYKSCVLGETLDKWEREHLCRWTVAESARLVTREEWTAQAFEPERPTPSRPAMGVKMDPNGTRLSAVIAWPGPDEKVYLDVVADVTGDPIDVERLGPDLKSLAAKLRTSTIAFDPATDADVMRHITRPSTSITARDYASATERFVRLVAGRKLIVHDPGSILAHDLEATTRKAMSAGTAIAVKADAERTNTAAEAAIRAVWAAASARPRLMVY